MTDTNSPREEDENFWAPGTIRLEDSKTFRLSPIRRHTDNPLPVTTPASDVILHPVPSSDPDDPLNWSRLRKAINFGLVGFFVLWTFVQLQTGSTSWGSLMRELHFSVDQLNNGAAMSCAGLAVG